MKDFEKLLEALIQLISQIFGGLTQTSPTKTTSPKQSPADPKLLRVRNLELIKASEGLRLTAYLPTANDVWTIGWGHTHTARAGMTITEKEAVDLLIKDVSWAAEAVNEKVKVPLTQNQFDALVSLVFNIGIGAFSKSTVLRRLNAYDYAGAADAFGMWNKQRNRKTGELEVLNGLTKRRAHETALFLEGMT